jgi:tRNA (guanine-N7-)-methyltransferase
MSKNKLKKFVEIAQMKNVFEFDLQKILQGSFFHLRGGWNEKFFKNNNPIVLELGCGRGEYVIGLAKNNSEKNYIGIDIKGARMWHGATEAKHLNLPNVAFVRTDIQMLNAFFAQNEVSEIWLTFPDPQMKKQRKRLTSTMFLNCYKNILKNKGKIHLKTDSNFLFTYTVLLAEKNDLQINDKIADLYLSENYLQNTDLQIKTYYESQWAARGITIKYVEFLLSQNVCLQEPQIEIEFDRYRSYGRQKLSELNLGI